MNYVQVLFSFFNVPLFVTFIIGIFWKRMTAWAGFSALLGGTLGAHLATYLLYKAGCRDRSAPIWRRPSGAPASRSWSPACWRWG